ncbi:hypothetical protein GCM10009664_64950 [Kitasatospora gansuensis]
MTAIAPATPMPSTWLGSRSYRIRTFEMVNARMPQYLRGGGKVGAALGARFRDCGTERDRASTGSGMTHATFDSNSRWQQPN